MHKKIIVTALYKFHYGATNPLGIVTGAEDEIIEVEHQDDAKSVRGKMVGNGWPWRKANNFSYLRSEPSTLQKVLTILDRAFALITSLKRPYRLQALRSQKKVTRHLRNCTLIF